MKIGDLVKAKFEKSAWYDNGIIIDIIGRKWLKVAWADGIIQKEHIDDLEPIRRLVN